MNNQYGKYTMFALLGAMTGCFDSSSSPSEPPLANKPPIAIEPPIEIPPDIPPPIEIPPDIPPPESDVVAVTLWLDGSELFDDSVQCNGQSAANFEVIRGSSVECYDQQTFTLLANFYDVGAQLNSDQSVNYRRAQREQIKLELTESAMFDYLHDNAPNNASKLIRQMAVVRADVVSMTMSELDGIKFANHYKHDLGLDKETFGELIAEIENSDKTNALPSSHTPDSTPASSGGSGDLGSSGFISYNAEMNYRFTNEKPIYRVGVLTNAAGLPIEGVEYYSKSAKGVTNNSGQFEYNWGETVSFGIETLELGEVVANRGQFSTLDLGIDDFANNVNTLLNRYGEDKVSYLHIPSSVHAEFSRYPNAINDILNLTLSSEDRLLDTGNGNSELVPAEFLIQLKQGLSQEIDERLCQYNCSSNDESYALERQTIDSPLDLVRKLWGLEPGWHSVNTFHVFHDSTNFYGSTGRARAVAHVPISNLGSPLVMARNDDNYWIDFGQPRAWDEHSLAYITESPSKVVPGKVNKESTTFDLPFVTLGKVGKGQVMVLGHAHYNSILVCPNGYSWDGSVNKEGECEKPGDSDDMANFFKNAFRLLTGEESGFDAVTNIPHVYFKRGGQVTGHQASFDIHPSFGISLTQTSQFNLDPISTPLVILNGYEYISAPFENDYIIPLSADYSQPKLTDEDINDLIDYVENGGAVLVMETSLDPKQDMLLARLFDSVGIASTGNNVVKMPPHAHRQKTVREQREGPIWVLERYPAKDSGDGFKLPYTIHPDGSVTWDHLETGKSAPKLELAYWLEMDGSGNEETHYAFIEEAKSTNLEADKRALLNQFTDSKGNPVYTECDDHTYQYQINCLQRRLGDGIPVRGGYGYGRHTELAFGEQAAEAMIAAANLGSTIQSLYQHERYFRTQGKEGQRLSMVDLERQYRNLSVWLWNDLEYRYEPGQPDDLGLEAFTEFLACYQAGDNVYASNCSEALWAQLTALGMLFEDGVMNPNYPLNYREMPITRLMLGRSYWDSRIQVDVSEYPGLPQSQSLTSKTVQVEVTDETRRHWYAGKRKPTGLWAPAHQAVTMTLSGADKPVTVTISLSDDLTGLEKHELGLTRPPRMTQTVTLSPSGRQSATVMAPYGGLIHLHSSSTTNYSVSFNQVMEAPLYEYASDKGQWVHSLNAPAPFGEVVTPTFLYTTASANLNARGYEGGILQFAQDVESVTHEINRFYARNDDESAHTAATDATLADYRHHFVNDRAISIGSAHSGNPVMNTYFKPEDERIGLTPKDSWLLWHEIGHNTAEAPLTLEGATEVANNVLALYLQERFTGVMSRVERDIRMAPQYVSSVSSPWGVGGSSERLLMYTQLKLWAQQEFDVSHWVSDVESIDYLSTEEELKGWNLFKLMHRLSRAKVDNTLTMPEGDNYCYQQPGSKADQLMVCASYVAQTDLSDFFEQWGAGQTVFIAPGNLVSTQGGISEIGRGLVRDMKLPKPSQNPLWVDSLH
ncbi:SslE/AcfD family lipoprotein zinc metalloprotease [Vibrio cholerae]